ncbi:unnamed protein product [Dicrocoelium dendriticum]|nr:unnamed protein product [Dicrocoelium dendriticum]
MPGIFPGFPANSTKPVVDKDSSCSSDASPTADVKSPKLSPSKIPAHAGPNDIPPSLFAQPLPGGSRSSDDRLTPFTSAGTHLQQERCPPQSSLNSDLESNLRNKSKELLWNSFTVKARGTRRRHMSANAVLSTSSYPVSSSELPILTTCSLCQATATHSSSDREDHAHSSLTHTAISPVNGDTMQPGIGKPWLDHHVNPAASPLASRMDNHDELRTAALPDRPSGMDSGLCPLPTLSGAQCNVDSFSRITPTVSGNGTTTGEDVAGLKLRLARAWQRKAERMNLELTTRVMAIVFTECPAALNLQLEGIGWGLQLLNGPTDSAMPSLFRPSILHDLIPNRVSKFRKWLIQASTMCFAPVVFVCSLTSRSVC